MSMTEQLLAQLERCAKQFRYYEQQHLAKATPDSDAKAKVNDEIATECETLVAQARLGSKD